MYAVCLTDCPSPGLHDLVAESIMAVEDHTLRQQLLNNIILCGGVSLTERLEHRLRLVCFVFVSFSFVSFRFVSFVCSFVRSFVRLFVRFVAFVFFVGVRVEC